MTYKDDPPKKNFWTFFYKHPIAATLVTAAPLATVTGIGLFCFFRYKVAGPSEYVVRTGLGIKDISVTKKALQLPFQTYQKMSIAPVTFPIEVDAMSSHRIPFKMPSVWTIGPIDAPEEHIKFAKLLMDKRGGLKEHVEGIIQGEARILTANLELNDLFNDRDSFKKKVVFKINEVISPFGLQVYNANIAELTDLDDHNKYFDEQKRRALQRVNQEARVAVAEAIKEGQIGEMMHQSTARQETASIEKDARVVELERSREIAEAEKNLSVAKAEYSRQQEIARIEAEGAANKRHEELSKEIEERRSLHEIEKKRANDLTRATVDAEIQIKLAEANAEAIRIKANADLYYEQQKAEGILAVKEAEAEGFQKLIAAAGNVHDLNHYLLVRDGVLPQLAEKQALALRDMKPKINIWNTGSQTQSASNVLTGLFQNGMPLFDGIKSQTGYDFLKSIGVKQEQAEEQSNVLVKSSDK